MVPDPFLSVSYKVIVAEGVFAEAGFGQDLLAGYHGKKLQKRGQAPFVRSTLWAVPANGA
jgi:hypothetical protein